VVVFAIAQLSYYESCERLSNDAKADGLERRGPTCDVTFAAISFAKLQVVCPMNEHLLTIYVQI